MTVPIPSAQSKLVDDQGRPDGSWMEFFRGLVGKPEAIAAVAISASPLAFTANKRGVLAVVGGTITAISLQRARVSLALSTSSRLIPVANGDVVTITYSAAPTSLSFIPS